MDDPWIDNEGCGLRVRAYASTTMFAGIRFFMTEDEESKEQIRSERSELYPRWIHGFGNFRMTEATEAERGGTTATLREAWIQ